MESKQIPGAAATTDPKENEQNDEEEELNFEQFLVYQARAGEIDDVAEMCDVRDPPVDINFKYDRMNMNTALHVSAANGHLKIVNLLLSQQGQLGAAKINPNI